MARTVVNLSFYRQGSRFSIHAMPYVLRLIFPKWSFGTKIDGPRSSAAYAYGHWTTDNEVTNSSIKISNYMSISIVFFLSHKFKPTPFYILPSGSAVPMPTRPIAEFGDGSENRRARRASGPVWRKNSKGIRALHWRAAARASCRQPPYNYYQHQPPESLLDFANPSSA